MVRCVSVSERVLVWNALPPLSADSPSLPPLWRPVDESEWMGGAERARPYPRRPSVTYQSCSSAKVLGVVECADAQCATPPYHSQRSRPRRPIREGELNSHCDSETGQAGSHVRICLKSSSTFLGPAAQRTPYALRTVMQGEGKVELVRDWVAQ